jgi:hypothetical protein
MLMILQEVFRCLTIGQNICLGLWFSCCVLSGKRSLNCLCSILSLDMWCVRGGTNPLSLQIVVVRSAGRVRDISQRCYRFKQHFSKMV